MGGGVERWIRRALRRAAGARATDPRGRRIVAVIECILNQNARDRGAATFAALNWDVVRLCRDHAVGIVQLPCPEREFLGLERARPPGVSIREALDSAEGRLCCRRLSVRAADSLEQHLRGGDRLVAVLGGNPESPGCAVHDALPGLLPESGVLMRELRCELAGRGIDVPFRGIRDADPALLAEDLAWLERVFSEGKP
jgi:predicted secreted protein